MALFDDTTSEVVTKNHDRYNWWHTPDATSPNYLRFDLADSTGSGEGGWFYFYDRQWKRFFDTIDSDYLFRIDNRPIVIMYHGGRSEHWFSNESYFCTMVGALKSATYNEFGFTPYVIAEREWANYCTGNIDAYFGWFHPDSLGSHTFQAGDIDFAMTIPGYHSNSMDLDRYNGQTYRGNLEWVDAQDPDLVLIESITNPEENCTLLETSTWDMLYLDITSEFTGVPPPSAGLLTQGEVLYANDSKCSKDGRYCLVYQSDGNLVLYHDSTSVWDIGTSGRSAGVAVMQTDGNFVVYDANDQYVWDSGTSGNSGAYLAVEGGGNLAVYAANRAWLWDRS